MVLIDIVVFYEQIMIFFGKKCSAMLINFFFSMNRLRGRCRGCDMQALLLPLRRRRRVLQPPLAPQATAGALCC